MVRCMSLPHIMLTQTNTRGHVDPYNKRLHFCQPKQGKKKEWSSIGAIVFGERVYNAPFEVGQQLVFRKSSKSIVEHPRIRYSNG